MSALQPVPVSVSSSDKESLVADPFSMISDDDDPDVQLADDEIQPADDTAPAADDDDVVAGRIKTFITAGVFPTQIKGATLKVLARTTSSLLNTCGVRVLDKDKVEHFICMLDDCYQKARPVVIKCTKSGTSNATKHITDKHGYQSSKTQAQNRRMAALEEHLSLSDPAFRRDPERWFQVSAPIITPAYWHRN